MKVTATIECDFDGKRIAVDLNDECATADEFRKLCYVAVDALVSQSPLDDFEDRLARVKEEALKFHQAANQ